MDYIKLDFYYGKFSELILIETGREFTSFSNDYIDKKENYKKKLRTDALDCLSFYDWNKNELGGGEIVKKIMQSIELKENNLVNWRIQQALRKTLENNTEIFHFDKLFYNFFKSKISDEIAFNNFIGALGKQYPLLAYIYFLKDDRKHCPIAPTYFDKVFSELNIDLVTSHKCSWDNYSQFNSIISDVKTYLEVRLEPNEVRLIDAHSFLWIVSHKLDEFKSTQPKFDYEFINYALSDISRAEYRERNINDIERTVDDHIDSHRVRTLNGMKAEEIVLKAEKDYLIKAGKKDLAELVKNESNKNYLGYDILSFEIDGSEKYIEVKSNVGSQKQFFLSSNELLKSKTLPNYYIYHVINSNISPYVIRILKSPDLKNETKFILEPNQYIVKYK